MEGEELIPAPIPAPEGYRPVFHDMDGLTPTEYRVRQRQRDDRYPTASSKPTQAEIVAVYRRLTSWTAAAEVCKVTPYYVKKAVSEWRGDT